MLLFSFNKRTGNKKATGHDVYQIASMAFSKRYLFAACRQQT